MSNTKSARKKARKRQAALGRERARRVDGTYIPTALQLADHRVAADGKAAPRPLFMPDVEPGISPNPHMRRFSEQDDKRASSLIRKRKKGKKWKTLGE